MTGRRLQKLETLAVEAALAALLTTLSRLVLATLLLLAGLILAALLTGLVLPALLWVVLLLLVALRIVLFVRHRDMLRNVRGWNFCLETPPIQTNFAIGQRFPLPPPHIDATI